MIKYITNPIHSLTQSYTAATITAKTQVSLTKFLQSEVKIIHIIVQNNTYIRRDYRLFKIGHIYKRISFVLHISQLSSLTESVI